MKFRFDNPFGLAMAALLWVAIPALAAADEPSASSEGLPPLELTAPKKHSGQVSFGFGTHGAFSQMSGKYSFSPRLYARYGLGVSQGFGRPDLFASSLTGDGNLEATQYFLGLGTPSLFQFGGGIDVGAEVFMSNGPLYSGSWLAPGFSPYGFGFFDAEASPFLSPWHQRAWTRGPSLSGNTWFLEVNVQETTDQGTRGARVTVGK